MVAPKGNKFNNKMHNFPKECYKAYEDYCNWISQGNSVGSWSYVSDTLTLSYKTMEKYIKEYPQDFPSLQKEIALTNSLKVWEQRGLSMMLGQVEKCQPAIFQMFMRNKFGWDKEDHSNKQSNETLVEKFLNILDKSDGKRTEEV